MLKLKDAIGSLLWFVIAQFYQLVIEAFIPQPFNEAGHGIIGARNNESQAAVCGFNCGFSHTVNILRFPPRSSYKG